MPRYRNRVPTKQRKNAETLTFRQKYGIIEVRIMDKIPEKATLDNCTSDKYCDDCGNPCLFHMKDSTHEFTIGLIDILRCVKFAENEGVIPEIESKWWNTVYKRYGDFNKEV